MFYYYDILIAILYYDGKNKILYFLKFCISWAQLVPVQKGTTGPLFREYSWSEKLEILLLIRDPVELSFLNRTGPDRIKISRIPDRTGPDFRSAPSPY